METRTSRSRFFITICTASGARKLNRLRVSYATAANSEASKVTRAHLAEQSCHYYSVSYCSVWGGFEHLQFYCFASESKVLRHAYTRRLHFEVIVWPISAKAQWAIFRTACSRPERNYACANSGLHHGWNWKRDSFIRRNARGTAYRANRAIIMYGGVSAGSTTLLLI